MATRSSSARALALGLLVGLAGCDLMVDRDLLDADGDGIPVGEDCDDTDPTVQHPTEHWHADCDGDGYGEGLVQSEGMCRPPIGDCPFTEFFGDCDDLDASVSPDRLEFCNGIDDDCDGEIDEAVAAPGFSEPGAVGVTSLYSRFIDRDLDDALLIDADGEILFCPGIIPIHLSIEGAAVTLRPRDPALGGVTLSGEALGRVLKIQNGGDVEVEDLTISGGAADAGGGIGVSEGTLRLARAVVSANLSALGGGIYIAGDSALHVEASVIEDNTSTHGGGIYAGAGAEVSIDGASEVVGNGADAGGGLFVEGAEVVIDGAAIRENDSSDEGGGIYVGAGAQVSLDGALVYENEAFAGGGVYARGAGAQVEITEATSICGNVVKADGGGIYAAEESTISLTGDAAALDAPTDCPAAGGGLAVYWNLARGDGGGIAASGAELTIDGVAIRENCAGSEPPPLGSAVCDGLGGDYGDIQGDGGGLSATRSILALRDVAIHDNASPASGGGLHSTDSELTLERVVVQNNTALLDGGGLDLRGSGSAALGAGVTIRANIAGGYGGGLYAEGALVTDGDGDGAVIVSDNSALQGGGLYFNVTSSALELDDAQLSLNAATERGGGLYLNNSAGEVEEVLFASEGAQIVENNSADQGGGLFAFCESTRTTRLLFEGAALNQNTATVAGGGAYLGRYCQVESAADSDWLKNDPDMIASSTHDYSAGAIGSDGFYCYLGCCLSCTDGYFGGGECVIDTETWDCE